MVNKKVNAVLNFAGVTFPFDINPHPATATATGVAGEDLSSLLHLTYKNLADNTFSASAPIQPGTYEVFASFDGNSTYLPVANFDTTKTIVISPGNRRPQSRPLPESCQRSPWWLAGKSSRFTLDDQADMNSLATLFTGNVTVNVTLATSPTGATNDPIVATISKKKLKIKENKTVPFGAVTIKTLPALTGTLFFIAKLTDSNGATNVIPFPGSITAAAPFIDLAALAVTPAPKVHLGKKLTAAVTLVQNGNIPISGGVLVELFLSLDSTHLTNALIDLRPERRSHLSLQPGKKGAAPPDGDHSVVRTGQHVSRDCEGRPQQHASRYEYRRATSCRAWKTRDGQLSPTSNRARRARHAACVHIFPSFIGPTQPVPPVSFPA